MVYFIIETSSLILPYNNYYYHNLKDVYDHLPQNAIDRSYWNSPYKHGDFEKYNSDEIINHIIHRNIFILNEETKECQFIIYYCDNINIIANQGKIYSLDIKICINTNTFGEFCHPQHELHLYLNKSKDYITLFVPYPGIKINITREYKLCKIYNSILYKNAIRIIEKYLFRQPDGKIYQKLLKKVENLNCYI